MVVPLIGYVDRFSGRPGEPVAVKVSSQFDTPYRADMVRIVHADANPAGPGIKLEEVVAAFAGEYPSRSQPIQSGSLGIVTAAQPIALPDPCTIVVRVQPWLLDGRRQAVLAVEDGLTLLVAAGGAVLETGGGRVQIPAPMLERRWYELRVVASDGRLRFRQTALQRSWGVLDSGAAEMPGTAGVLKRLALGAGFAAAPRPHDDPHCAFFNGCIEDPAIILEAADEDAPIEPERSECLAWWDFRAGIGTDRILDREHALNGSLRNLPTRAVRGSRWSGDETNWQHAPRQYAAIHFHEDDLYDCGWETDFAVEIPDGMASGVYGVRLRCGDAQDIVPFYVLPPVGTVTAPIAFLASTFTYQIYGNHRRGNTDEAFRAAKRRGGPIRGTPTSTPNTTPRRTTHTPTAAASAIRACAGRS